MKRDILVDNFEHIYENILIIESILLLTKESCLEREFNSIYYDLENDNRIFLSKERNHYINMLSIAQDKIEQIKTTGLHFENNLSILQ